MEILLDEARFSGRRLTVRAGGVLGSPRLIVDGVPDAKSRGVADAQECFPAALTCALDDGGHLLESSRIEPLAADLRPEGDTREHAKLKLIADKAAPTGILAQVMDQVKAGGIKDVAIGATSGGGGGS